MKILRFLCLLACVYAQNVGAKKKKPKEPPARSSEWSFDEVTYSPINDRPSVSASLPSVTGREEFNIFCHEGELAVNFWFSDIYISTVRDSKPVIYRVDSEKAVDCTDDSHDNPDWKKCSAWSIGANNHSVGIWGDPDEFIQEIKDAKKLTVRVNNLSGDQRTAFFILKDVLPTYEKIKSLCNVETAEPDNAASGEEATP